MRTLMFIVLVLLSECVMAATKKCSNCAENVLDSDVFCPYCGNELIIRPKPAPPSYRPKPNVPPAKTRPAPKSGYLTGGYKTKWTPIKFGLGMAASIPSVSASDFTRVDVYGLDFEFCAHAHTLCGCGIGWIGAFNKLYGIQCAVIGNGGCPGFGVQVASIFNGLQSRDFFCGVQAASFFNLSHDFCGLQLAFYNGNDSDIHGIQVGVINTAKRMTGIQIGVLNFIDDSHVPFFPIVNMCF